MGSRRCKSRIYLVSCVAQKGPNPAAAQNLYESTWFRLARRYVERSGAPWFILSAKYGLVTPDTVICPYDTTLNRMGAPDRLAWAGNVQSQMDEHLPDADKIIVLAGARYREHLETYLRHRFPAVEIPMEGLRIGEQLNWLNKQLNWLNNE